METKTRLIILLALIVSLFSHPARASIDIESLFNDLCKYGALDSDTCAAKTLVSCLVKDGGNAEAMLKCAGDYDPKAKKFIDIYFAAVKPDYVKVIELAGPIVACQAAGAILPPGPPKEILCSEVLAPVVKNSFGTAAQIYQAAATQNWAKLIYLAGPGLGCQVIDDYVGGIPGKELLCGTVAKVIEEAVKIAKDAAKAGKAAGKFLLDTGSDIVNGVGGALDGACEGIGLCDDDDGKKLMSASQYYTYRLFPLIHDRVLARLTKGQQALGHDNATLQACLKYYNHALYAKHPTLKQLAPKVQQGCEALGARLHKEADAMAVMFDAAAASYFDASVKPYIPAMIAGGKSSWAHLNTVKQACLGSVRATLPLPEPTQPGTTAWDHVCNKVAALFSAAYLAEENKIAAILQQIDCKKQQQNSLADYQITCATYEALIACKTAYTPQLPCSVDKTKADSALAAQILKQLGTKRCRIESEDKTLAIPKGDGKFVKVGTYEKHLLCTRPWKVDQCKTLLDLFSKQMGLASAASSAVKCMGDAAGLAAFAQMDGQASALRNTLNGASGPIGSKPGFGDAKGKSSAGTGSCKSGDPDTLKIHCPGGEFAAHPQIMLPVCPADPNLDGADAPCRLVYLEITKEQELKAPKQLDPVVGEIVPGPLPGRGTNPQPPRLGPPPAMVAPAGLPAAAPARAPSPDMAPPPADAGRAAPTATVPGCAPVAAATGQYACATREAYAGCERLRAAAAPGVRACLFGSGLQRR